jgi:hypothetical protein
MNNYIKKNNLCRTCKQYPGYIDKNFPLFYPIHIVYIVWVSAERPHVRNILSRFSHAAVCPVWTLVSIKLTLGCLRKSLLPADRDLRAAFDLNTSRDTRVGLVNKTLPTQLACRVIWVKNILPDLRRFHKNKMAESCECKRLEKLFFPITLEWVHFEQTLQMTNHPTSFMNHC